VYVTVAGEPLTLEPPSVAAKTPLPAEVGDVTVAM